jgi:hypothetical protein
MEPATSPILIVLVIVTAVTALGAWWLSIRAERGSRDLVAWIMANHRSLWEGLPRHTRWYLVGAIELLRRRGLGGDPEFMVRYKVVKRGRPLQLALLAMGIAGVGAILLGVRYLGWVW